jgi:hypothetical protein
MAVRKYYLKESVGGSTAAGELLKGTLSEIGGDYTTSYAAAKDDVEIRVACEAIAGARDLSAFQGAVTFIADGYTGEDPFADSEYVPPVFSSLQLANRNTAVTIKGVEFRKPEANAPIDGVTVDGCSAVVFEHCRFKGFDGAGALVTNCWTAPRYDGCRFEENGIGLICQDASKTYLTGNNVFLNNLRCGIAALRWSQVHILDRAPGLTANSGAVTRIKTTRIRKEYVAIKALADSEVWLRTAEVDPADEIQGYVAILDEGAYRSKSYFGVVLETRSALIGSDNVYFSDPFYEDGEPTVPPDQQIMARDGHGAVIVP